VRISDADGGTVTTIEGLAGDTVGHPVQQAWIEEDVPQCGYCQAGQVMQAAALLADDAPPEPELLQGMQGNVCRCGTYRRIRRALRRAAGEER
jgi:aerobic-type carbon monoxide dehydrogenase small subunit (CoxS/CutS family)